MRNKYAIGNWKMNMTPCEAKQFLNEIIPFVDNKETKVVFCVPYIDIPEVRNYLKNTSIGLGAENFYFEDKGAFTGEVSLEMLSCYDVQYVIIGHSERRQIFKEDNEMINKKLLKALSKNFVPILCCGEALEQREKGETLSFIEAQIISAFSKVTKDDAKKVIIAYEPIWAIGTGKTATDEQAEEVCCFIRNVIKNLYGEEIANDIHILYGGSVNAKNASSLFSKENIDGGLVGGASLKMEFVDIVEWNS